MNETNKSNKRKSFVTNVGCTVPSLKMMRFSCFLRLSLPPEMGTMTQTFVSVGQCLGLLKWRTTCFDTSSFLTERRCSGNLSERRLPVSLIKILSSNTPSSVQRDADVIGNSDYVIAKTQSAQIIPTTRARIRSSQIFFPVCQIYCTYCCLLCIFPNIHLMSCESTHCSLRPYLPVYNSSVHALPRLFVYTDCTLLQKETPL